MGNDGLHKLNKNIGSVMRKHRKKKGISQAVMGDDINLSSNQVGRIERAQSNPTIKTLYSIAEYLEIEVVDLVSTK